MPRAFWLSTDFLPGPESRDASRVLWRAQSGPSALSKAAAAAAAADDDDNDEFDLK